MNTPHIEYSQEKLKILDHKVLDIGYYNPIYEKNGYFFLQFDLYYAIIVIKILYLLMV